MGKWGGGTEDFVRDDVQVGFLGGAHELVDCLVGKSGLGVGDGGIGDLKKRRKKGGNGWGERDRYLFGQLGSPAL